MNEGPGEAFSLPADMLAQLVTPDAQRLAARMAQDAFTRIFRLTLESDPVAMQSALEEIERLSRNWARAAETGEGRALRLALLVSGVDQWGLAYCQAFELASIPGVTTLLGALRSRLDAAEDARFQSAFTAIDQTESHAIDFKMELRRNIHLALWHAMTACEDQEEAQLILAALGSLLLALVARMPVLGWRLAADALANIQLRCLSDAATSQGLAQEMTQELFEALRRALPRETFDPMLAHANQAVIAWQQSRRLH
ncbi:MAG: hypothetical protein K9J74_10045 [Sulfuritalea sp.]|nr:hypothetical protein [Sulfuritalea sp.]